MLEQSVLETAGMVELNVHSPWRPSYAFDCPAEPARYVKTKDCAGGEVCVLLNTYYDAISMKCVKAGIEELCLGANVVEVQEAANCEITQTLGAGARTGTDHSGPMGVSVSAECMLPFVCSGFLAGLNTFFTVAAMVAAIALAVYLFLKCRKPRMASQVRDRVVAGATGQPARDEPAPAAPAVPVDRAHAAWLAAEPKIRRCCTCFSDALGKAAQGRKIRVDSDED